MWRRKLNRLKINCLNHQICRSRSFFTGNSNQSKSESSESSYSSSSDSEDWESYYTEEEDEDDDEIVVNLETEKLEDDESLLRLPLDIFLDILSRLSVNLLGQCKCVCKTWGKLISHHRFTTMHYTRSIHSIDGYSTLLVPVKSCTKKCVDYIYLLEDRYPEQNVKIRKQKIGLSSRSQFDIVGSSQGLLCLYENVRRVIYITNPVTGEYVELPELVKSKNSDHVYGFGYDEVSDDYKVIRLVFKSTGCTVLQLRGEIYQLGLGVWRDIGDIAYPLRGISPVFVNAALHWMTDEYIGVDISDFIISFNLSKEDFSPIPPPLGFVFSSEVYRYNLADLKSNLCLSYFSPDKQFEIWMMKEYGVKDSWTKDYVICDHRLGTDAFYLRPIEMLENEELLLEHKNESLICYSDKQKSFRQLYSRKLPPAFEATIHVKSLVSLRGIC